MYRKRPIAVEAFQMTAAAMNRDEIEWPLWLELAYNKPADTPGALKPRDQDSENGVTSYTIYTLEGPHVIERDVWIIQGPPPRSEIWGVQPDIFAETYEPVPEE